MSKRRVAVLLAASAMAVALLAGVTWAKGVLVSVPLNPSLTSREHELQRRAALPR